MKTIRGKRYEQVQEVKTGGCVGCVASGDQDLCLDLRIDSYCAGKIWKEVRVEKTVFELMEAVIQDCCPGSPQFCRAMMLKRAIEREQDAAIRMHPISELPECVPDGCIVILVSHDQTWTKWSGAVHKQKGATHFYILPLPAKERKLHACYIPGCGGDIKASVDGKGFWRMRCATCHMLGPPRNTEEEAKDAWGWE